MFYFYDLEISMVLLYVNHLARKKHDFITYHATFFN